MVFKIVSTSPTFGFYVQEPVDYLRQNGCDLELIPQGKKLNEEELLACAREADGMIVGVEKMTERILTGGNRLKVVAKHGAGVDNIDITAATRQGIVVTSAPGANSDAVADLTFGLFLSAARSIPLADRLVKAGQWPRIVGTGINGKTLGIIGVGQIGKKVAKRALGFDMKVLCYDVAQDDAFAQAHGIKYVSLKEIFTKADFISIHVPLLDATRNLISTREFGLMKKNVFLVNAARGGVVDEKALYTALKENKIGGAACDVFTQEPAKGNPLLTLENLVATPHMGMYTKEALVETGMMCVRNIVATLKGGKPDFLNNPEVLR